MRNVIIVKRILSGAAFTPLLVFMLAAVSSPAQDAPPATNATVRVELPPVPAPMAVPAPGPMTDAPYAPQPILLGGIVIPLFPPNSPYLNPSRIREPEVYNMNRAVPGRIESIVNIHNPSIEVHLIGGGSGTAVILCAGGGHDTLNVGPEGSDFYTFFKNYGITTIILRNRLRSCGYNPYTDEFYDTFQAIRMVRAYAAKWKIDPHRIGIMGFSAGAELATGAGLLYNQFDQKNNDPSDPFAGISSRPDFVGMIYPGPSPYSWSNPPPIVISSNASKGVTAPLLWDWHVPPPLPKDPPPSFICNGGPDQNADWAMTYFGVLLKARVPNIDFHYYGNGHHGGGLVDRGGTPYGTWSLRFIDWIRDLGFLQPSGVETKAAKDIVTYMNPPPRRVGRRGGGGGGGQGQPGANAPNTRAPQPPLRDLPDDRRSPADGSPGATPPR
jgi:acetyl esterase/lipase